MIPLAAIFPGEAGYCRVNTMWLPSADHDASRPLSMRRRGSPPRRETRKSEKLAPVRRLKSSVAPSGENRGRLSSGPSVSATSVPVASCLSQIRPLPSRSDRKAIERPSGEAAGEKSWPEYVK